MSVTTVSARVAELDQRLTSILHRSADSAAFARALQGAQAAAAPAAGTSAAASGSVPYAAEIEAAAARHGLDPALLKGLIKQESGFDPSARSSAGASGLTQLMPATAASLGVTDPTDPAQSIEAGAAYLAQQLQRFGGDVTKAVAAYNAGPGAVARYGGVPPYAETQAYVRHVLANAAQYRGEAPAPVAAVPVTTTPVPATAATTSAAAALSQALAPTAAPTSTSDAAASGDLGYAIT